MDLLVALIGLVIALMPCFIYAELRRQGRARSEEARCILLALHAIRLAVSPEVVDDPPEPSEPSPSGRRIIIRR